jgi:NAD-dependent SIR2 family protein deacetylase
MTTVLETVRCQRCQKELESEKAASVVSKNGTMRFCDNCFRAVFKYDKNLKTVQMIWEENQKVTPFVIRSTNWHGSSYMVVKEVKSSSEPKGRDKIVFVGDMFLRGQLKEQNKAVGKANHFIWFSWSEELAKKHLESIPTA